VAFVVSAGQLASLDRPTAAPSYSVRISPDLTQDYATIWRTQPSVRTVVSFLARALADIPLHVFRRVSDTDRERLTDHPMAALIARPLPGVTTWYRLMDSLIHDLGIYDAGYWLKVKGDDGNLGGLVRLPPAMVTPVGDDWLTATAWRVKGSRGSRDFPADQVVHFRGYNPDDARMGCSPIETLRRILAEEHAATEYRDQLWRNSARFSGYLERPAGAPGWSAGARERFRESWHSQYSGNGPGAGGTPILEDGMTFKPNAITPVQAQYLEARKLTREEVASSYHIPLPMVGILDNATFSNIREQHLQLYQDTLGPWLTMLQQEIALQLLPDLGDVADVYVEFNLATKLRGSFEEQAGAASTSTGRPWMTVNETRARNNLPALDGGDELVVPLNVLVGGQASPTDSAPPPPTGTASTRPRSKTAQLVWSKARAGQDLIDESTAKLQAFFRRQQTAFLADLDDPKSARAALAKAGGDVDLTDWDDELADVLDDVNRATADAVLTMLREALGVAEGELSIDVLLGWLQANAEAVATAVNATTSAQVSAAMANPVKEETAAEAAERVFKTAIDARGPRTAITQATNIGGFVTEDTARRSGYGRKRWITQNSNPRKTHARMHGETVAVGEKFSIGGRWPGDGKLKPAERSGCTCDMELVRDEDGEDDA